MQWCSRVHFVRVQVQWVRVRVHLVRVRVQWFRVHVRVRVQASRSDRMSKSCHSQYKCVIRNNNTVTCWQQQAILQHIWLLSYKNIDRQHPSVSEVYGCHYITPNTLQWSCNVLRLVQLTTRYSLSILHFKNTKLDSILFDSRALWVASTCLHCWMHTQQEHWSQVQPVPSLRPHVAWAESLIVVPKKSKHGSSALQPLSHNSK